jgi:hypothetical protein
VDRTEDWTERKADNAVRDVEDFPDNAARWAGDGVRSLPSPLVLLPSLLPRLHPRLCVYDTADPRAQVGNVERGFDDVGRDIGAGFDDVGRGVGDAVGDVERFGDGVADNYDAGVQEGRDGW